MITKKAKKNLLRIIFPCLLLIFQTSPALAAFSLNKVRINLSADTPVDSIRVGAPKEGKTPVLLQVRLVQWSQKEGKNSYEKTKDLIVAPPFIRLMPGAKQILRIGLRKVKPITTEESYRLFVREITPMRKDINTIQFRLNMSLPVFVTPVSPTPSAVFLLRKTDPQHFDLGVKNTGNVHLQIISVKITDDQKNTETVSGNPVYVLPGQSVSIPLVNKGLTGVHLNLDVRTDAGVLSQAVILSS